ncbi:prephenate dehydratase [Bifidobacterium leontopitheci]|uniref:Prephenate dehydratase n=1 Tax=Bifidobacterium leontopitheci TaxID=2650774 RepID=A0A6I1GI77_9BIFI|nr:chorismate mutase [Bifidobacterium leontopitheci]
MTRRTLHFLGPQGTFTHQAALDAATLLPDAADATLVAEPDAASILSAVQKSGEWGVIAWENNIEGYVVPNLDALIDATDIAGIARIGVDVSFDAYVRPGDTLERCSTITAHPHGLAQCREIAARHHLKPVPAASNGAACRDLTVGQVALGPRICGNLYGLDRVAAGVEDYAGAHTDFLMLAPRSQAADILAASAADPSATEFESIIAFIPLSTGPGVLANLLDVLRDAGLNMTSFISRPIKGRAGTYSFIATIDAAPWQDHLRSVLAEVAEHGDWVKTLAVYPRQERPNPPVYAWSLPNGGVRLDKSGAHDVVEHDVVEHDVVEHDTGRQTPHEGMTASARWQDDAAVRKELLW